MHKNTMIHLIWSVAWIWHRKPYASMMKELKGSSTTTCQPSDIANPEVKATSRPPQ